MPATGDKAQFPGWPITITMDANDGRKVTGYLPELLFTDVTNPVVQVIDQGTGEMLYTVRVKGKRFQPRVYGSGPLCGEGRQRPARDRGPDGSETARKRCRGKRTIPVT